MADDIVIDALNAIRARLESDTSAEENALVVRGCRVVCVAARTQRSAEARESRSIYHADRMGITKLRSFFFRWKDRVRGRGCISITGDIYVEMRRDIRQMKNWKALEPAAVPVSEIRNGRQTRFRDDHCAPRVLWWPRRSFHTEHDEPVDLQSVSYWHRRKSFSLICFVGTHQSSPQSHSIRAAFFRLCHYWMSASSRERCIYRHRLEKEHAILFR